MSAERTGGVSYRALAAELRAAIASGELAPGDPLPSEVQMAADRGTTRITVGRAYAQLAGEGLIASEPRVGSWVRRYAAMTWRLIRRGRKRPAVPLADPWIAAMADSGATWPEDVSVGLPPGDTPIRSDTVGNLLGVGDGHILVRECLRSRSDGAPVEWTRAYYPEDVVDGTVLRSSSVTHVDAYPVLADAGNACVHQDLEISSRMPRPAESERLQLLPATPVTEIVARSYTGEGRCVEVRHSIIAGGPGHIVSIEA
ncbi:GntR family transcriptional regulator [Microtetraspora fusca]|uniref:GntR family transcriptional regulator n=1 Tax=Microtetraspora fusca TaxID=1997 RepID=A0ABW6VFY3_MICFU